MAPDASGPSLKSATIAAGRLESSFQRTGSPLPTKTAPNTITSAPLQTRTTPQKRRADFHNDRESDSSLSEFEGGDSDAETERLHLSPQKQRPGIMVQHTGSSTGTATALAFETIPVARENAVNPAGEPADNHRQTRSAPGTPTRSPSKKRKRDTISPAPLLLPDDPEGKSVLPPPPKKKVYTPGTAAETETIETAKVSASENKEYPTTNGDTSPKNATVTNGDDRHSSNISNNTDATVVSMDLDQPPDDDAEDEDPDQTPSAPPEEAGDSADVAQDEDEDAEREEAKKQKAIEELAEIERIFAKLKDSIYNDKLHRVEIEMKMLMDGTHPEYVAQKKVIDERLEEKVRLADAQYKHAMESLTISTNVHRSQVHSQYFQQTRQLREDALYNCSELWYNIHQERRTGDALVPEYTFRISDRQSTRVRQRMQYNWEVQILGGIQKHIGFPAAPDVDGATDEEKAEDLEALGIPLAAPARSVAPSGVIRMEDIAQHNWVHHSPPSSVVHAGAPQLQQMQQQQMQQQQMQQQQQAQHSAHIHRHHHHHHRHVSQQPSRPQPQQEQPSYPPPPQPRRIPANSNLGLPPSSSTTLLSLLHPSPESGVKMEAQPSQASLSPFKSSEVYSNFPNHLAQQQQQQQRPSPYSIGHHLQHPFGRTSNNDSQHPPLRMEGRRSPTPGERMHARDHELDSLKRMKEDVGQATDRIGGVGGGGLRGPLYRPGGGLSYT